MPLYRKFFQFIKKAPLHIIGILLVFLLALLLLWRGNTNSSQALAPFMAQVRFQGEYQIGDGAWQSIENDVHIPAGKGDVTLRGQFHLYAPDGEYVGLFTHDMPIAFYTDHINLTFFDGETVSVMDRENPLFGFSSCSAGWTAHSFTEGNSDPIEIHIHNPHRFGNETAIDEMLDNIALWHGIDFEKQILDSGEAQRNTGLLFMIVSLVLLGTALSATFLRTKNNKFLWLVGLLSLSAGTYFMYSAPGISFRSESIVTNTLLLGISMMFYMLFLSMLIAYFLKETKKAGVLVVTVLGVADALFLTLPMVADILFYDTYLYWGIVQGTGNIILIICLVKEFFHATGKHKWLFLAAILPLICFGLDALMTALGIWKGGIASQYIFFILFLIAMVMVSRIIPRSLNAAAKAKKLETEKNALSAQLAESRISTMMSQIRPHFIYNTLGTIEHLCEVDPAKAGALVHSFAKYLRGNFGELDNPSPIRMSQEMEHVRYYISIEKVRFPDMTFTFEMGTEDFSLPALSIQPIVENAIKHGLMKLEKGGSIRVVSYETESHYCVSVEDDGVGFDTTILQEDDTRVGIRNIRERLKAMVDGSLEIESTPGVGTKALITIPKEVEK